MRSNGYTRRAMEMEGRMTAMPTPSEIGGIT